MKPEDKSRKKSIDSDNLRPIKEEEVDINSLEGAAGE
jgi:hypothetical protein